MNTGNDILQELSEISPFLALVPRAATYRVPDGYFGAFPSQVSEWLGVQLTLEAASAPVYDVPGSYFEQLPGRILARISQKDIYADEVYTELAAIAPALNTISGEEVYAVPASYFDQADFITPALKSGKGGRVVTLRIARKWIQYAAAAVVTGILVTGAFLFTDDTENIKDPEAFEKSEVSSSLNKVSDEELLKYVETHEHILATPAASLLASEEELKDVKSNIRHVSDEELKQYLKENGELLETPASEKEE